MTGGSAPRPSAPSTFAGPGSTVLRTEDGPLVRGAARYLNDLRADQLVAVFVRSTVAAATIRSVDTTAALAAPGVVTVASAADLDLDPLPAHTSGLLPALFDRPVLATGCVRFVGEPIAVVVAGTYAQALDAAALVEVDYVAGPAVVDPEAALAPGAPLLFPARGTNLAFEFEHPDAGALAGADVIVGGRFVNQRVAPAPMEPNGALAVPEQDGTLTVWASTQRVHALRDDVARSLRMDVDTVRVVTPQVGGGFGGKYDTPVETVAVSGLARRLGRPVMWQETRTENLTGMAHGRGQIQHAELGLDRGGKIVGLRCDLLGDAGGYPSLGALVPSMAVRMLPWVYGIARVDARCSSAATNTSPVGAYRGPGRAEVATLIERLMDMAAAELGVDPVELRRRNLIPPDRFPFTTATGMVYDVGDYRRSLDEAVAAVGYHEIRAEQERRRRRWAGRPPDTGVPPDSGPPPDSGRLLGIGLPPDTGRLLGIGVAMWLDITPSNRPGEYAAVDLRSTAGRLEVVVRAGTCDQGQAHATTWGLLLSELLGVPIESVSLLPSDTARVPTGTGTGSARSLQVTGGSVLAAGRQIVEQARAVAAQMLEAAPEDIAPTGDGGLAVAGSPGRSVPWAAVAAAATSADLPAEVLALLPRGGLGAEADVEQAGPTFPSGTHAAVVEVDTETGRVDLLRFVAVDDCGRVVNPVVVAGQQHGGVAQGIAQALYEEVRFDADGTPRCTTFADYLVPSASDLPALNVRTVETPTPVNPMGAKGIGQAGAIGATPAVQNAVVDALAPLGIRHLDLPMTPERVWRAVRDAMARRGRDRPAR